MLICGQIPTALVLKHCDIIAITIERSHGSGTQHDPIKLDVPLRTFRDWIAVLYTCVNSLS